MTQSSIALFVSHSWSDSSEYHGLVQLLESLNWIRWSDLSIAREHAFLTHREGAESQLQELELLRDRLAQIETQRSRLWQSRFKLERIREGQELEREIAERLKAAQESPFSKYMSEIESANATRRREEFVRSGGILSRADVSQQLASLKAQEQRLSRQAEVIRRRVTDLENSLRTFQPLEYGSRDILYLGPKVNEAAIATDSNLVLMLRERIARADVVLVIAQPFHRYRMWLDCEFELASDLLKPILTILPSGTEECSLDLRRRSRKVVPWNARSVGEALLEVTA